MTLPLVEMRNEMLRILTWDDHFRLTRWIRNMTLFCEEIVGKKEDLVMVAGA